MGRARSATKKSSSVQESEDGELKYTHYEHPKLFGKIVIQKLVGGGAKGQQKVDYMERWYILRLPWFSIRLHHLLLPDLDKDPHDHPWAFVSFVLKGWYEELWAHAGLFYSGRHGDRHHRRVRRLNHHRLGDVHKVTRLSEGGCWTLIFTGPLHEIEINGEMKGAWGFETRVGLMHYTSYLGLA